MSESELTDATAAALRPSGLGQLETTIATELAIAIFNADPLQKVRHIVEAFSLLPEESRKQLVNKKQEEEIQIIYTLTISFLSLQVLPMEAGDSIRHAAIPFPFTPQEANKYLSPFVRMFHNPGDDHAEWFSRVLKGDVTARREYFQWFCRKLASYHTLQTCLVIKNEFLLWAIPRAITTARQIISKFITKETWEQALAATLGKSSKHGSPSANV